MTDPYKTMTDAQDAERKAGDAMIEARNTYNAWLRNYANGVFYHGDDFDWRRLSDAYNQALAASEEASEKAKQATEAWLKTVT